MKACVLVMLMGSVLLPLTVASEPRAIKIGLIASLTGAAEQNGKDWYRGSELAIDEMRAEGNRIEVIVEDDGTAPAKVASAFSKLATVDKVDGIIGGTWDFLAATAAPLAAQWKIPFITPTNPVETMALAVKKSDYVFTNGLTLASIKEAAARFIKAQKPKSIALIYIDVPYGSMNAQLLKDIAKDQDIQVLLDIPISYDSLNESLKSSALKVKLAKPDLVFVVLNYSSIDLLFQEFERLKVNPTKLITHTLLEAYLFAQGAQRYANAFGIFQKVTDNEFAKRFEKRFSSSPIGYAPNGYDAAKFLVRALQHNAFKDGATPFVYQGITGEHRLNRPNLGLVDTQAGVYRINKGVLELASQ